MKEVERNSVTGYGRQDINYNDPEGEFVYYEDYAKLQQQLTATTNILKSAGIEADTVQAGVMELKAQRDALAAEHWLTRHYLPDGVLAPVTTDVINRIRAEGVEILTGKIQQLIDEGVFDGKEIGVAAGVVYEGAQISAQLRAGNAGKDGV